MAHATILVISNAKYRHSRFYLGNRSTLHHRLFGLGDMTPESFKSKLAYGDGINEKIGSIFVIEYDETEAVNVGDFLAVPRAGESVNFNYTIGIVVSLDGPLGDENVPKYTIALRDDSTPLVVSGSVGLPMSIGTRMNKTRRNALEHIKSTYEVTRQHGVDDAVALKIAISSAPNDLYPEEIASFLGISYESVTEALK